MCDQGIKDHKTSDRMNRTGHVAPANRAKREILPVETDTGKVYNGSAGKKVGALTGKENMSCTYVESGKSRADLFKEAIVKLISHIDNENKRRYTRIKDKGGFTVNDRLLQLRAALNLTQDEFGARIGVSRSTICNYENGTRSPMEQTIRSICREFNVEYLWLTEGVGEMFRSTDDDLTAIIDNILMGENETAKAIFRAFAKLDDSEWLVIKKIIDEIKKIRPGFLPTFWLTSLYTNIPPACKCVANTLRCQQNLQKTLDFIFYVTYNRHNENKRRR